jgi:hypothetical protein
MDTWKMKSPQAIDQIADSEKGTLYKPQTIDGSAVPGSNFKEGIGRYKDGDVVGRISPEHTAEITSIGQYKAFNPAEMPKNFVTSPDGKIDFGNIPADIEEKSNGKYPEAPIRLEKGSIAYGQDHISDARKQEMRDAGYIDELDMLSDVAKNYTQIYEQPNGRLLLVKKNGKSKYAVVELQKNPDNYYGTTTMFFDEKPLRGKPYEERSGRKLLLEVAPATDSGKSVPFVSASNNDRAGENWRSEENSLPTLSNNIAPQDGNVNQEKARIIQPGGRPLPHIPHNTPADAVGKPEGLSGSQVENSSLIKDNIASQDGNVNKNSLVNNTGSATMQPAGGNISEELKEQLDKLTGQRNTSQPGVYPSMAGRQSEALEGISKTLRGEGYNLQNSKAFLKELDDYLSSTNIPLKQQAQIKQNITDGIRKNSQMGKIVPRRTISGQ